MNRFQFHHSLQRFCDDGRGSCTGCAHLFCSDTLGSRPEKILMPEAICVSALKVRPLREFVLFVGEIKNIWLGLFDPHYVSTAVAKKTPRAPNYWRRWFGRLFLKLRQSFRNPEQAHDFILAFVKPLDDALNPRPMKIYGHHMVLPRKCGGRSQLICVSCDHLFTFSGADGAMRKVAA